MSYTVGMPPQKSSVRWSDVLDRKQESALPFLRFYRDAGLIPTRDKSEPPPFVQR